MGQDGTDSSPLLNREGRGGVGDGWPHAHTSSLQLTFAWSDPRYVHPHTDRNFKSPICPFLFLHFSVVVPQLQPPPPSVLSLTRCSLGCFHCTERLCSAAPLHIVCTLRRLANGGNQSTQMRFDSACALHYNQSSFSCDVSSF